MAEDREAREVDDDVTEELARAREAGYAGGRGFALALARMRATLAGATEGMLDIRYGDDERREGEEEFLTLGDAWVAAHAEAPLREKLRLVIEHSAPETATVSLNDVGETLVCDGCEEIYLGKAAVGNDDVVRHPVYTQTHEGERLRLGHVIEFPDGDLTPVVNRPGQSAFYGRTTRDVAEALRLFRARRSL